MPHASVALLLAAALLLSGPAHHLTAAQSLSASSWVAGGGGGGLNGRSGSEATDSAVLHGLYHRTDALLAGLKRAAVERPDVVTYEHVVDPAGTGVFLPVVTVKGGAGGFPSRAAPVALVLAGGAGGEAGDLLTSDVALWLGSLLAGAGPASDGAAAWPKLQAAAATARASGWWTAGAPSTTTTTPDASVRAWADAVRAGLTLKLIPVLDVAGRRAVEEGVDGGSTPTGPCSDGGPPTTPAPAVEVAASRIVRSIAAASPGPVVAAVTLRPSGRAAAYTLPAAEAGPGSTAEGAASAPTHTTLAALARVQAMCDCAEGGVGPSSTAASSGRGGWADASPVAAALREVVAPARGSVHVWEVGTGGGGGGTPAEPGAGFGRTLLQVEEGGFGGAASAGSSLADADETAAASLRARGRFVTGLSAGGDDDDDDESDGGGGDAVAADAAAAAAAAVAAVEEQVEAEEREVGVDQGGGKSGGLSAGDDQGGDGDGDGDGDDNDRAGGDRLAAAAAAAAAAVEHTAPAWAAAAAQAADQADQAGDDDDGDNDADALARGASAVAAATALTDALAEERTAAAAAAAATAERAGEGAALGGGGRPASTPSTARCLAGVNPLDRASYEAVASTWLAAFLVAGGAWAQGGAAAAAGVGAVPPHPPLEHHHHHLHLGWGGHGDAAAASTAADPSSDTQSITSDLAARFLSAAEALRSPGDAHSPPVAGAGGGVASVGGEPVGSGAAGTGGGFMGDRPQAGSAADLSQPASAAAAAVEEGGGGGGAAAADAAAATTAPTSASSSLTVTASRRWGPPDAVGQGDGVLDADALDDAAAVGGRGWLTVLALVACVAGLGRVGQHALAAAAEAAQRRSGGGGGSSLRRVTDAARLGYTRVYGPGGGGGGPAGAKTSPQGAGAKAA